jgi:hypothetical protein
VKRALARWRWAGVGVIWDADDTPAEAPAITAASQPSTVSVTVVYVQAGAHLTIGGVSIDAPAIQAIPQRDAINASTTEETDGAH